MNPKPLTTSWLWPAGDGVNGLQVDAQKKLLKWFDAVGCACGDSTAEQSIVDFRSSGPAFPAPPEDVLAELEETLRAIDEA